MAKKSLKEKLDKITAEELAAITIIRGKHSGLRAAEILKANTSDLLAAGIANVAEHPDMKIALGARAPFEPSKPEPTEPAKGKARAAAE